MSTPRRYDLNRACILACYTFIVLLSVWWVGDISARMGGAWVASRAAAVGLAVGFGVEMAVWARGRR